MNKTTLRIDLISAIPEMFHSVISESILKIAQEKHLVEIHTHNLHDYADNKFKHIDDYPFGGGAGMLIQCDPVFKCIEKLKAERDYDEVIFMTADGQRLDQNMANGLSMLKNIIILSGHYKGIDQRIRDVHITQEISLGDFVLSGGEIPTLVLVDSIVRLLPDVLGDAESALEDSYMNGLLEPPQFTRPAEYKGHKVPEILLGGNHKEIAKWREDQAYQKTKLLRPDLLD